MCQVDESAFKRADKGIRHKQIARLHAQSNGAKEVIADRGDGGTKNGNGRRHDAH